MSITLPLAVSSLPKLMAQSFTFTEVTTINTKNKFILVSILVITMILTGTGMWYQHQKMYIPSDAHFARLQGIPILMYHKVNPDPRTGGLGLRVPPDKFEWQMKYLKRNGYETISLTDVLDHFEQGKHLPDKPIVITFDDGYKDNHDFAYPIMKKYGYTGTVFVVTQAIGNTNFFDVAKKLQPENKMMNWSEIREIAAGGFVIGSHTVEHPRLAKVSPEVARQQIEESKRVLEQGLKKPVEVLAYPYGSYNDTVAEITKQAGYRAAVTTELGLAKADSNPYKLKRVRVTGRYSNEKFIEQLHKY
ncbi:polysaccharide deacetylase family protein [Desulforamulus aeronauticus]|uniref:Polysaccharide deacetylase n=1 Tax=Desulforamulus aeronauticus DSM 10349 TaxID=1121421 RepID=A0A1M6V4X4_9FIRM|nr:polysaccharide deacetylase family protein [Desulforamulus aeronauticus]SHK76490.1 Polysaccharide deacetylase [Desulforamulus aeronauticus DSM 10349]